MNEVHATMTPRDNPAPDRQKAMMQAGARPAMLTSALVVAGDLLLFDAEPGINLLIFGLLVSVAVAAGPLIEGRSRRAAFCFATGALLSLPLLEAASPAGLLVSALGIGMAALFAFALLPDRLERVPGVLVRFGLLAPFRLLQDMVSAPLAGTARRPIRRFGRAAIGWTLPMLFGLVFLMLFSAANPVIEAGFSHVRLDALMDLLDPARLIFWAVLAAAVWAVLRPRLLARRPAGTEPRVADTERRSWLSDVIVLRSLILFNLIFGFETALDLTFLWGGAQLPEGITYAAYAHRGALPLIASALLAAAFVLVTLRPGGAGERNGFVRGLVYAWIGQNVMLCLSAMLRLDLYVEAYSLTAFRLLAGVWMALVAIGLLLIVARIHLQRSNAWLVATNLIAVTLVTVAFATFDQAGFIARYNVAHSEEVSGQGVPLDLAHMRSLGPAAIPALDTFIARTNDPDATALRDALVERFSERDTGWRSWTWRQQRLADYLAARPDAGYMRNAQLSEIGPDRSVP